MTVRPGYTKIDFCGKQAARDGYEYFWIDTVGILVDRKEDVDTDHNASVVLHRQKQ